MRPLLVTLILIVTLTSCASWNKRDKTLLVINGVVQTIDALQTNNAYVREDEGYYEINPVIDWGVDRIGRGFIPLYFLASFGARWAIADIIGEEYRPWFLGAAALGSTFLVLHNNSIGLEIGF